MSSAATEEIVVRALGPDQVDVFRELRLQALADSPDAYVETLEQGRACDWQARIARLFLCEPPERVAYVAYAAGSPVGMVIAAHRDDNGRPFLAAMWVHPDFRRRSVGNLLVERALAFLSSAPEQHVSLWVTETHAGVFQFYEKLGFQRTGAKSTLRSGSDITILELARLPVD
jgi:ribosomal protein S18 acetylase RimI-like enzyme